MLAEGKGDIFILYNLPQNKIRPEFLADSVEKYLRGRGRGLSDKERQMVLRLSKEMQKSLPKDLSAGQTFLYVLLATSPLLGLSYDWGDE